MIEHLEKSTNIVKSNEKLIAAIIANVLLMILFILFNGLIIENHYLIMGSFLGIFYAILSDYKETLGMEKCLFCNYICIYGFAWRTDIILSDI